MEKCANVIMCMYEFQGRFLQCCESGNDNLALSCFEGLVQSDLERPGTKKDISMNLYV